MSVREMIRDVQRELRDTPDLLPDRAAEMLNQTTALLGNINDELRIADLEYKRILLECLQERESANRAKIEAETTPQYVRRQEAQHTKELAIEMIRSLKIFLKAKQEEMRLTR